MFYYQVWVRSSRYHGNELLTYSSKRKLKSGSIVQVELQKEQVLAVVNGPTAKPRFQTKPISLEYRLPIIPKQLLQLLLWLPSYYPAPLGVVTQLILPAKLSEKLIDQMSDSVPPPPINDDLPPLTDEQTNALLAMHERDSYLLHGVTGSGKTRLYIELALEAVRAGKSAIILTPEISLTSQLTDKFRAVFPSRVLTVHSRQTDKERQSVWLEALNSKYPRIIIGPRSALFCPINNIGLIVLDEAHENAYKQEKSPTMQTGRVAAYYARLCRAKLVLGTATPSVNDYYLAKQKQKPIIELKQLAKPHQLNQSDVQSILIIDRKDKSQFGRSSLFSQPLIEAVEMALGKNEQSLLYLNRRGTARIILCDNCGWQATCPHCDLPLTYHGDSHSLRCHSCNYHSATLASCPACHNPSIIFKSAGTKAVADEAIRLFPGAKVARFDTDNSKAESFESQYENVRDGNADILVGTQLIAKGLDLPKLSTLGIMLADTSLFMPDFTAEERTFQLIVQVLGRIGRGHVSGHAIIQTYHPSHPILLAATRGDYQTFYESELISRRQYMFPPFCFLAKLTLHRSSAKNAMSAALKLKSMIIAGGYSVAVEGPAPRFYEKVNHKYYWQLVVKAKERKELVRLTKDLGANVSCDLDPIDLL